jgi:hypothetical protein
LQKGDDVIEKLFVTGTFLLESPAFENLRLLDLKAAGELQYSCGFQEAEALKFAESFLGEAPCIAELCRSCGEYRFSPPKADSERIEPVLHPQRFLTRVAELSHQQPLSGDDESYDLLSTVLRQTPDKSDVPSALTVDGLINLVATGAIEMDGPLHAPLHSDGITLRWSVLYYLGAVTHDRQSPTTLRLTNSVVLSLVGFLPFDSRSFTDKRYLVDPLPYRQRSRRSPPPQRSPSPRRFSRGSGQRPQAACGPPHRRPSRPDGAHPRPKARARPVRRL